MADDDDKPLIYEDLTDGVLTLRLEGGAAHALSSRMIAVMRDALDRASSDDAVKVLVVHGPGRIFCAGHDLKEIARHRTDEDQGRAFLTALLRDCAALMTELARLNKPTIAMVEGIATAAGLQMVAACDLAFVSQEATFCLPGVLNGGFCSTPSVAVTRAISGKHAMEMALSGETYDADWAERAGLVNRILPGSELIQITQAFAAQLATRHMPAVSLGKQTLQAQAGLPLDSAYELASEAMLTHFMDPARIAKDKDRWGRD